MQVLINWFFHKHFLSIPMKSKTPKFPFPDMAQEASCWLRQLNKNDNGHTTVFRS